MRAPVLTALVPFLLVIAGISQNCTYPGSAPANFTGIYGTVIDPTGAVISDAHITIIDSHGQAQTESSSDSGLFCVKLKPGDYKVEVGVRSFQTATQNVQIGNGAQLLNFQLQPLHGGDSWGPVAVLIDTEPADTSTSSLHSVIPDDVQKAIKSGIYGTVVDPTEAGIGNAQIKIIDEKGNTRTAHSDRKGRFKVKLGPGTYKVEVASQGFQAVSQKVEVQNGSQQLSFMLKIGTCCSGPVVTEVPHDKPKTVDASGIYGIVTDQVGAILVQCPLVATDDRGKRYTARVDLNGMYRLDLPPGKYKVEVAARGFQTATQNVQIGKDAQKLNFKLQVSPHQETWSGPAAPPPIVIEPADTSTSSLQSVVPEDVQKAIKSGVYGMVVDPTGAVIPRTHVVAIDQHGKSHDTCSNSEGTFQMKLKRGSYQVSASAQGFRTVTQNVKVNDAVHDLNFRLTVESGSGAEVFGEPMKPEPCAN